MSFIPGMTGAAAMTKSVPPLLATIEKIAHSISNQSDTVAWPLGHQAGDLVVFYDWKYVEDNGGTPGTVIPTGFTQIFTGAANSGEVDPPDNGRVRTTVAYKILDGTEPGVGFITGMGLGNRQTAKTAILFRGNLRLGSVTVKSLDTTVGQSGYDDKTITSGSGTKPLIVLTHASIRSNTQVQFAQQTPAFQEVINNANHQINGYFCYPRNSTPVNHIVDVFSNLGGGSNWGANEIAYYLEVGV